MSKSNLENNCCSLDLPMRTAKPRIKGITAITDVGIPIGELRLILEDYGVFLDIAKLGVGTAAITPRLIEKIQLYREYGVQVYFGGTLFEKYYSQGKLAGYVDMLRNFDVTCIEVSNGSIDISLQERLKLIREFASDFTVLGEVGCKDADKIMPPSEWIEELLAFLEAGCTYVITEGRDSGTAGIYRSNHDIRTGLISDIIRSVDANKIIFEAPKPDAQMFFINTLGANVNLGNISVRDLLLLETQRCALRCETLLNN